MKFYPLLCNTSMVQSILINTKDQTRRIVKPQPNTQFRKDERVQIYNRGLGKTTLWEVKDKLSNDPFSTLDSFRCPYGKVGDILWVRETFGEWRGKIQYRASTELGDEVCKWKPNIHMPKTACRIFLKIIKIRVERLCDISKEDAIREGIEFISNTDVHGWKDYMNLSRLFPDSPRLSFFSLYRSIYGDQSWEDNPWVWVIEFKRVEKPQNF